MVRPGVQGRGQLKTERLSLTRRHHGQHIPAEENSFHDFSLAMAKTIEAKSMAKLLQKIEAGGVGRRIEP